MLCPVTLALRPVARDDFDRLSQWLAAPHVSRWWRQSADDESIELEFGPIVDGTDATEGFIAEIEDEPIGYIQRYLISDYPAWQAALGHMVSGASVGFDYLIGIEALTGQGFGPQMIEALVDDTWLHLPESESILVDVLQENRASWRALEKAHFERIWSGELESGDPSDQGPCYLYRRRRSR
jgi:RimJ/RimL family protein N-acetyltransferase